MDLNTQVPPHNKPLPPLKGALYERHAAGAVLVQESEQLAAAQPPLSDVPHGLRQRRKEELEGLKGRLHV